jgi:hypothetical protein
MYEQLWTASRVADLLHGEASRIRLEPPGDDGVGIEFEIDTTGRTWGEQTKHSASTWTIKRLRDEGVLSAAKHQVERGRGFRVVTSSAATALEGLSERARAAGTLQVFKDLLTTRLKPDFDDLRACWGVTEELAWEILKSIVVEHHPFAPLRRNVRLAFQILYARDPELVIGSVRDYCDDHIHENITAPQVAAYLKSRGFQERLLAGDENTRRQLHRTLERQQRRVRSTAPDFGFILRPEARPILEDLIASDRPRIVVVDAPAGYGKSAVAAEVATALDERGWFVAVARMDVGTAMPTSDHLGQLMGLSDSPSVLLAGVADGAPGLLVVDQLDAVSLFSGRMPDSYDAVEEVLEEIGRTENLKVLLVVRSVDLENDQRLRSLVRNETAATRHTLGRLGADDIRRHLTDHDIQVPNDQTVELLRTPLHLSVYARLSDEARELPYRTLQDLYDQLTPDVRRRAAERAGHLDWRAITSFLVATMSENEALTVTRAALDRFPVEEVAALESEHVLTGDESGLAFFHESYFDYLFARAFVESGRDIHAFLASTGQFLFRRAQTRQVLEYLAATDHPLFRDAFARLLASPDIRSHLKHVVVSLLRQLTPDSEDWAAIEDIAWTDETIGPHLIALLSDPGWFDAADRLGRWEAWLDDTGRVDSAAHQLVFAARKRGKRVAELVRRHIGASEDWRLRLRALIAWSLNPDLVPLAIELIGGGHIDDVRGPIAVNSDFWSIVYGLIDEDPEGAAQVTGAFLNRGLQRAHDDGSADPFESGHLSTHSSSESIMSSVAEKAPRRFVAEVLPFVVSVAQANQHDRDELLPAGARWGYRSRGSNYSVDDVVFAATEDALCRLAASGPDVARGAINELRVLESEELRFLACRTLTVLDDPNDAIAWLTADPRNLVLGWSDSPNWAARELIAAHTAHCSDEIYARLEAAILGFRSKFERRAVGYGQFVLLSGLDHARMSETAQRRLAELERKFSGPPPEPRPVIASIVGSPISEDATKKMSDDNWLAALRKHDSNETNWSGDVPVGGAMQLAQALERRAREDPERFARLALRFDGKIPATAGAHVVRGTHAEIDVDLLTDLCDHVSTLYGDDVGRDVCSAIEAAPMINGRMVALLERYATSKSPDRQWARTDAGGGVNNFRDDLFHAGLNSTRGGAALAVASALFKSADHLARLLPLVEDLASDPNLAVRTCAAEAVVAVLNHDNDRALAIADKLLDGPIDVFDARTTEHLLTFCILRSPERFSRHLERAIEGPNNVAERGGHVWAIADYRGSIVDPVGRVVNALPTRARVGAAKVLAENIADTASALIELFDDPEPDVRRAASRGMRSIAEVSADAVDALIEAFVRSDAFGENMENLFDSLERLGTRLPVSALEACERVVESGGRELGDIRTARAAMGGDLIAVTLRLYRQGDPATRSRCLDIIDRLIELNVHGVDGALVEER